MRSLTLRHIDITYSITGSVFRENSGLLLWISRPIRFYYIKIDAFQNWWLTRLRFIDFDLSVISVWFHEINLYFQFFALIVRCFRFYWYFAYFFSFWVVSKSTWCQGLNWISVDLHMFEKIVLIRSCFSSLLHRLRASTGTFLTEKWKNGITSLDSLAWGLWFDCLRENTNYISFYWLRPVCATINRNSFKKSIFSCFRNFI